MTTKSPKLLPMRSIKTPIDRIIALTFALVTLFSWPVSAQVRPGVFSTLQVTSLTAASTFGCAIGVLTNCTGLIVAGTGRFTTGIATDAATVPTHGIAMASGVPSSTSFVLYNDSGTIKWNGVALAAGSSLSGTLNQIPRFTSATSVGDSIMAQDAGATTITITGTLNTTTAYQLNGTSINATGTLSNVAYQAQSNYFNNASGQRFSAGIALDDGVPSTHGIIMPSAVPGSLINAFYNNSSDLTWTGGGLTAAGRVKASGDRTYFNVVDTGDSSASYLVQGGVDVNSGTANRNYLAFSVPTGKNFTWTVNGASVANLSNAGVLTATTFIGALTGNASTATTATTATTLLNARTICGQSFNGSANISLASTCLTDTANIAYLNAANTWTAQQVFSTTTIAVTCDGSTDNNNLNIGSATVVQLTTTGTGSCSVTGFTGGVAGRVLLLISPIHSSGNNVNVFDESSSSSGNNRIQDIPSGNANFAQGSGMTFVYEISDNRWVAVRGY